jgi:hypothetical protein
MGRCNAQTNASASGVPKLIVDQGTARLSGTYRTPPQLTARGLELINSCAKFYANGAGVVKPRVEIAHLRGAILDEPPTRQTSSSGPFKSSIGTVAVMGSVLLVLPSLTLSVVGRYKPVRSRAGSRCRYRECRDSAIRKPRCYSTDTRCSPDRLERPVRYHHSQGQDAADNWRCQGTAGSRVDGKIVAGWPRLE